MGQNTARGMRFLLGFNIYGVPYFGPMWTDIPFFLSISLSSIARGWQVHLCDVVYVPGIMYGVLWTINSIASRWWLFVVLLLLLLLLSSRYYVLGESSTWAPAFKKYPVKKVCVYTITSNNISPTTCCLHSMVHTNWYIYSALPPACASTAWLSTMK